MRSRKFFGSFRFKDINSYLYDEDGKLIYENHTTTFANVNPLIGEEIKYAVDDYKKNWVYRGEPVECEIYTAPACKTCTINLVTGKKEFIEY